MKLFDAHCHVQPPGAFARAVTVGVSGMAVCGTSSRDWKKVFQTSEKFSQVYPLIGIHPWFVSEHWKESFKTLEAYCIGTHKYFQSLEKCAPTQSVGIGETGLDFGERFSNRSEQEECFAAHLDLARELNRPVAVHCVKAWGRLIEILKEHPAPRVLLHAFGGAPELIPELIELNCWVSFCGNVTNPNAGRVRAAAVAVPSDRLLIETDSPDFPPSGSELPNEPASLIHVARAVAKLRGVELEPLAELIFDNSETFFIPSGCKQ